MSSEELLPGYRPCVGIMVFNRDRQVWIGRRADAPDEPEGPGAWWQMPQGGIDASEEPRAAALRELYEETCMRSVTFLAEAPGWQRYDLPASLAKTAWSGRYKGQQQKWFAVEFQGEESEISIIPPPGHKAEFDRWRWAPLDELLGLVVAFKRDVYAEVIRHFRHLAR